MDEIHYWIWLSKLNLNPNDLRNCLKNNHLENIWKMREKELTNYFSKQDVDKILQQRNKKELSDYAKYLKKHKINILTFKDKNFPKGLNYIDDGPVIIYALGDTSALNKTGIAIVGSRNCSKYGQTVSQAFAYSLSKNNINIISGLAIGIDKAAHEGSILAGGQTIAVVGTGLDIIYPKENKELFFNIINKNGLIISEFPLGIKPYNYNFPKRNRIISAISEGVLVVEATKKSGALITVEFGLEQGKNIYAIPRKHFK